MKIDFEMTKDGLVFRDAIVLPDDHKYTSEEIEAMKKTRFDNWCAAIATPAEEIPQE